MQSLKNLTLALESVPFFVELQTSDADQNSKQIGNTAANDIDRTVPGNPDRGVVYPDTEIHHHQRKKQCENASEMSDARRVVGKQIKRAKVCRSAQIDPAHIGTDMLRACFFQKTEILLTFGM